MQQKERNKDDREKEREREIHNDRSACFHLRARFFPIILKNKKNKKKEKSKQRLS